MDKDDALRFGIPEDDRRDYVRLDRAKLNIARTAGRAVWFRLVGVRLDNANEVYPSGDEAQTLEPWSPPETWAGVDKATIGQVLDAIAAGLGGGNFYTAAGATSDRAAWQVVTRFVPGKSEKQAREIIGAWLKSGLLVRFDYESPTTRKIVKGLKVDDAKRPL